VVKRIENEKKRANTIIKLEEKKKKIKIAQLKKKRQLAKKSKDSITVVKTKKGSI
jgi:hypothetical protein